MSETLATPITCRCPNCGHRLCDIVSGVVLVKCRSSRNQVGQRCGHLIRFTREPGSDRVIARDLSLHPPGK